MEKETIDYNNEPVFYCKHCLSILIGINDDLNTDYCITCGSTDIEEAPNYEEWEKLYIRRYGRPFSNYRNK